MSLKSAAVLILTVLKAIYFETLCLPIGLSAAMIIGMEICINVCT